MSLRLVLAHYLASLRERRELDVLVPELLRAMGHSIFSLPQVGVAQAGVDIASTWVEEDEGETVFLWVLKFGDVGRADMYNGPQAIDQSVREARTEFVERRLPATMRSRPIRVIVVSNGVLKQGAQAGFTALVDQMARDHLRVEFWGMDQLTPLIEMHVFDEALLLGRAKADLRASLAGIEESETTVSRFKRFIEGALAEPATSEGQGIARRKNDFLRRAAAAAMGYAILVGWGHAEGNRKPGVVAGEYVLLRLWSVAVAAGWETDEAFQSRLQAVAGVHCQALLDYFEHVGPVLLSPREMTLYRPNHVFYAHSLFEELGRFATLLLSMQHMGAPASARQRARSALAAVINKHTAWMRPVLDNQTIDIALVIAAFLGEGDITSAASIVRQVTETFRHSLAHPQYLPVDSDLLEDAVAAQISGSVEPGAFFEVTTLVPMLSAAAASMGDDELHARIREVLPHLEGVSLEEWWPTNALETVGGQKPSDVGISRLLPTLRARVAQDLEERLKPPVDEAGPEAFHWHGTPWAVLMAFSARLFRHPVPIWYLARAAQGWPPPLAEVDEGGENHSAPSD